VLNDANKPDPTRTRWRAILAIAALACVQLSAPSARAAGDAASCIAAHNLGNDLQLEGKLLAARAELAECAAARCPKIIADECAGLVARIDANIPTVVLAATDRTGDVSPIQVFIDDRPAETSTGRAIAIDPGEHSFRVVALDGRSATGKIVALEGQKNRMIRVTLPDLAGLRGGTSSEQAHGASVLDSRDEPVAPVVERSAGPPTAAWVLGGVGVLALGSFGYFAWQGKSHESDLEERCAPRCSDSEADELYRNYLIADISLGVGVAALGAATYLFVTSSGKSESVAVRVAPARGGGAVAAHVRF
jgi:hypothetical protein